MSLRGLVDAGKEHLRLAGGDPDVATTALVSIAGFLHHELPIRLARRVVELDGLPSLHEMPSVRRVREWYARSAAEISQAPKPADAAAERDFARLLATIYERHAGVLYTMAHGAYGGRAEMASIGPCVLRKDDAITPAPRKTSKTAFVSRVARPAQVRAPREARQLVDV